MKRLLALAALAGIGVAQQAAVAAGTAANTAINNRATITYSVGSAVQTPIESSPTGNTTAGTGNGVNTSFVVDDKIDLTVTRLSGAPTTVNPGQANVVASFRVSNTGNAPHAYQLAASNVAGTVFGNADSTDVSNLRIYVDSNGNGTFEAADSTANINNISTLAADGNAIVFVVADVPLTVTNGQYANVRLIASAAVNNTPATLVTQSTGADNPAAVDFVFADGTGTAGEIARDGKHSADDQFAVQSASLTVTKTSTVVSDPFNGTTNPKAIPLAIVEYSVTVANTGGTAATSVTLDDPLPANTTFQQNVYSAGTRDVRITINAVDTFCVAEAGGTDTNGDGCVRTGSTLRVGGAALPTLPPSGPTSTAVIRFQVAIN